MVTYKVYHSGLVTYKVYHNDKKELTPSAGLYHNNYNLSFTSTRIDCGFVCDLAPLTRKYQVNVGICERNNEPTGIIKLRSSHCLYVSSM